MSSFYFLYVFNHDTHLFLKSLEIAIKIFTHTHTHTHTIPLNCSKDLADIAVKLVC